MGCKLLLLEYYGLPRSAGRGCHHDNGVAKGAGTTSGKGKERACNEPGACVSSTGSVRAYARAVARVVEGVGAGRVLWSVRREVTMQSTV